MRFAVWAPNTAGLDTKVAAGTTGLVVVFSSLSGFLGRIAVGNLDGVLVGVSAVAAAAGSFLGSRVMATQRRSCGI